MATIGQRSARRMLAGDQMIGREHAARLPIRQGEGEHAHGSAGAITAPQADGTADRARSSIPVASTGDSVVRMCRAALALVTVARQPAFGQKPKSTRPPGQPRCRPTAAPPAVPPTTDSLAAISGADARWRVQDSIAWLGSDAMTALSIPPDGIRRLIVRRTDRGWEVVAGKLSDDGAEFLNNGARDSWDPGRVVVHAVRSSSAEHGLLRPGRESDRGIDLDVSASRAAPLHRDAIPAEDGPWWLVYLYPAPLKRASGRAVATCVSVSRPMVASITEARRLHESITEYSVRTARPASSLVDRQAPVSGEYPGGHGRLSRPPTSPRPSRAHARGGNSATESTSTAASGC